MRWLVLILAACSGGSSPPIVASGPPAAMLAPSAGPDDVIVANVNGRPVWGSCITTQVKASPGKTKQIALDECISFELLAQVAEQRGIDRQVETIDATRTALVGRLVDQFAARTSPDALRTKIDELYKPAAFTVPERRESWHVLVLATEKDSDSHHVAAKALAGQIYAALQNETGLLPAHLKETAKRVAAGSKLVPEVDAYQPIARDHRNTLPEYRGALFAIPDVGRVSSVTQTSYGYHVILLSDLAPASSLDREAAGPIIYGNLRRRMFDEYLAGVVASSGIKAQPFPEVLDRLAQESK